MSVSLHGQLNFPWSAPLLEQTREPRWNSLQATFGSCASEVQLPASMQGLRTHEYMVVFGVSAARCLFSWPWCYPTLPPEKHQGARSRPQPQMVNTGHSVPSIWYPVPRSTHKARSLHTTLNILNSAQFANYRGVDFSKFLSHCWNKWTVDACFFFVCAAQDYQNYFCGATAKPGL